MERAEGAFGHLLGLVPSLAYSMQLQCLLLGLPICHAVHAHLHGLPAAAQRVECCHVTVVEIGDCCRHR
jgi:hypothetical protein